MKKIPMSVNGLYAHMLAFGSQVTEELLYSWLIEAKQMGYIGMVIVPALFPDELPPDEVARIFKKAEMQAIVCLFNPGNGPNPLSADVKEIRLAKANLDHQLDYTTAFIVAGLGPKFTLGPAHAWHKGDPNAWNEPGFERWMDTLNSKASERGIKILCEVLNIHEDRTPDSANTVLKAVRARKNLGIHLDTGHIHSLLSDKYLEWIKEAGEKIGYTELVNERRLPCDESFGIDFRKVIELVQKVAPASLFGVEPFDPENVVIPFELTKICQRVILGRECLRRDIAFFGGLCEFAKDT